MGDYRHIDMVFWTKSDPEINSAWLENYKNTFKRSNCGGKFGKNFFGVWREKKKIIFISSSNSFRVSYFPGLRRVV